MAEIIQELVEDKKYVELTYKIIDVKSEQILTRVEYPIAYVHGSENQPLLPQVTQELEGKTVGDTIEVPIDCEELYGKRDESLVITDFIENVPEEYREVGTTIVMENESGHTKNFIVTRIDEKSLTIDGNHPLCGREVIFQLEIITVREATDEEIEAGGKVGADPDINEIMANAEKTTRH